MQKRVAVMEEFIHGGDIYNAQNGEIVSRISVDFDGEELKKLIPTLVILTPCRYRISKVYFEQILEQAPKDIKILRYIQDPDELSDSVKFIKYVNRHNVTDVALFLPKSGTEANSIHIYGEKLEQFKKEFKPAEDKRLDSFLIAFRWYLGNFKG